MSTLSLPKWPKATRSRVVVDQTEAHNLTWRSLEAQAALLPQALMLFGVCLPVYVWAGSYADNTMFMAASFAIFSINWGAFYGAVNWLKTPAASNVALRLRVHILGGLLWAVAVGQIAAFADHSGSARESLLLMASGAAVLCIFFASSNLPCLLIITPVAILGPLASAVIQPASWWLVARWGRALTLARGSSQDVSNASQAIADFMTERFDQ